MIWTFFGNYKDKENFQKSIYTFYYVSGAQGVIASPFTPLHGLGSPLAAPYAGSPVGGTTTYMYFLVIVIPYT